MTRDDAVAWARELEARLESLIERCPLPERPDAARADAWLVEM